MCDIETAWKGGNSGCPPAADPTWTDAVAGLTSTYHLIPAAVAVCVLAVAYAVWAVAGPRIATAARGRKGSSPAPAPAAAAADTGSARVRLLGLTLMGCGFLLTTWLVVQEINKAVNGQ